MNNTRTRFVSRRSMGRLIRYSLICVLSILLGYLGYINASKHQEIVFISHMASDAYGFCERWILSSIFDLALISISALSTLTFFCPAVLSVISSFWGVIHGVCVGYLINNTEFRFGPTIVFTIYIIAFIMLSSYFYMSFLDQNRRFIDQRQVDRSKKQPYFSKLMLSYILKATIALGITAVLHLLLCILTIFI